MQEEIREISIKEILKKLLYRYKIILLVALVGMGLMLLYGVYKTSVKTTTMDELTAEEKKGVEQLIATYEKLHYYEDYYENSLLLKENSYAQTYAVIQYYIDSEYLNNYLEPTHNDYTNTIATLYSNYVKSYQFANDLKSLYDEDIDISYISELISITTSNNVLRITVLKTEGVETEEIYDVVNAIMGKKESEFQVVGAHSIELLEESENVVKSDSISNAMANVLNAIDTCKTTITTALGGYSDAQKEYLLEILEFEEYKENIKVSEGIATSKTSTIFNVKRLVLGFGGGIVAACVIYCIIFLLSDKLQYVNDMKVTYGISIFGTINCTKKVADSQINNIIESISLYCNKHDISALSILTGSEITEGDSTDKIIAGLKEKGVATTAVSYMKDEAEALKKATESGNVVFVEKIEESRYSAIKRQIDMLKLYNTEVIGSVVISKY